MKKILSLGTILFMIISLSLFASAKSGDIEVIDSTGEVLATYEIVIDDTSEDSRDIIQKALKYAGENASASDIYTVKLPKGEYGLYQSLNLFSNTVFDLSGSVMYRGGDCSTMMRFGYAKDTVYGYDGYENITLKNGTLDGDDNGRNSLMHFAHASGVEISNMTFKNTTDANHLLAFAACENVVIKNCTFKDMVVTEDLEDFNCEALQIDILRKGYFNYPAYDGTTTRNVTITGCSFENVARGLGTHSAMIGYYFDGIKVKNNTFKNIESYAVRAVNYINSEFSGNTITNCGSGISCGNITNESLGNFYAPTGKYTLVENANIIISDNSISLRSNGADTAAFGIRLIGKNLEGFKDKTGKTFTGDLRISGVRVENNTITSSVNKKNFNAIHVDGAKGSEYGEKSNLSITGNKITFNYSEELKNTVYGIKVWDSENVYIYKNKITDKAAKIHSGMTLDDCKGIIIKKNTVTGADNFGIKFGGTEEGKVSSNTVSKTGSNGIYIFTGSENVSVSSNTIKDSSGNGIAVSDGYASSISSNKIYNCKKYSIYITQKGKVGSVTSNYVCGGNDTGVYLNQKASVTTISKNKIDVVSNKVDGICVNNSAKFSNITNNEINVKANSESKELAVVCKYGIRIASDSCNGKKISGNTVKGCASYSIYLSSKAKVKSITSNYVCGGKDTGIYLNSSATATNITDNIIDVVAAKGEGICINNSAKFTNITGNKINTKEGKDSAKLSVKSKHGIRIASDSCQGETISGNIVKAPSSYAIYLSDKSKVNTIDSNYVCGGNDTGIYLNSSATANNITNNIIDVVAAKGEGICINNSAKFTNITGNKINTKEGKDSAKLSVKSKHGIRIASDSCQGEAISGNIIKAPSSYAIYLSSKSKVNTVDSNYVCGGKDTGIYLNNSASVTTISDNIVDVVSDKVDGICVNNSAKVTNITGNKINTKTEKDSKKLKVKCKYGIRIASDSCSAKKIDKNTVKGCSGYSIYISGNSKVKTISSNYVCGGKSSGIYLNKKASATNISKNTVDIVASSGDGICVNDSAKATNITGNKTNTKTEKDSKKLKVNCRYGIRINSKSCKAKKISDNTVNSCNKTAIYIPVIGSKVTVSGNKIKKTQNGIVYKKGKASLSNNTIQNCSSAKTKVIK